MSDGPTVCRFCGSTDLERHSGWGKPFGWCRSCKSQWNMDEWIGPQIEDAADDYRLSSATRKEWAERALKAEAELKEARMQSLSDAGQAQEAYERQLELEAERDRLREAAIDVGASLLAVVSLLEKGGMKAAPSNKMFEQMLRDYKASIERARAALNTDRDT